MKIRAVVAFDDARRMGEIVWVNHRYRFTTWRWGRVVVALLLLGGVIRLAMPG